MPKAERGNFSSTNRALALRFINKQRSATMGNMLRTVLCALVATHKRYDAERKGYDKLVANRASSSSGSICKLGRPCHSMIEPAR